MPTLAWNFNSRHLHFASHVIHRHMIVNLARSDSFTDLYIKSVACGLGVSRCRAFLRLQQLCNTFPATKGGWGLVNPQIWQKQNTQQFMKFAFSDGNCQQISNNHFHLNFIKSEIVSAVAHFHMFARLRMKLIFYAKYLPKSHKSNNAIGIKRKGRGRGIRLRKRGHDGNTHLLLDNFDSGPAVGLPPG